MRVVCLLFSNPSPISEIAEACYRWTPQVALRSEEAIFLEIERCHRLYSEHTLMLRLHALLKRFNTKARIAIADDVFMSLAQARCPRHENSELPLEALLDVASPFKKDPEIDKKVLSMIEELKRLGLKNLGDFIKLTPKDLSSRFHYQSLELHRRLIHGSFDESLSLWPRFVPPEKIRESVNLEYAENCQTLEPLMFVIKKAVGRAMARLAARGERLSKASLHFELEKFSTVKNSKRSWIFDLPLSQGAVTGLLPLIQERLNFELGKEPLVSSVERLHFDVLETVPGQYFQRHFFSKKEEEQEAWNSLITRLCEKLGRTFVKAENSVAVPAVFVAESVQHYKPEKAWKRTVIERQDLEKVRIDIPLPDRPLRLLTKPEPLQKKENTLIAADSKDWEILDWEGPERLSGEWWGEEFKRDYFRVGTKSGEQLWVFRIPGSAAASEIYLHGYFD
jgi:protein ImuB